MVTSIVKSNLLAEDKGSLYESKGRSIEDSPRKGMAVISGPKKEGVGGNLAHFSLTGKDDFQISDVKSKKDSSDEQIFNFINPSVKKANLLVDLAELRPDDQFGFRSQKKLILLDTFELYLLIYGI